MHDCADTWTWQQVGKSLGCSVANWYIYSRAQKFETTSLKSGILQQVWKIVSSAYHIVFMLEEHCYMSDASITTFKSQLLMIWLSCKRECSKLSQVLLLKIWAKKWVTRCGQVKVLHCMKKDTQKGKYDLRPNFFWNDQTKLVQFSHNVWKDKLMNTVVASFNTNMGQITKMYQWKKKPSVVQHVNC